jgi:cell division protein ZapE
MSPSERYREQLESGCLLADPAQARAVDLLDDLYRRLVRYLDRRPRGLWARLRWRTPAPLTGLYLWGGVGRGKTWLMDLLFHSLPQEDKRRLHFHRFMGEVHRALEGLKGCKDPLERVAEGLVIESRVLCLDELQVWDIGDAMILGGLLEALFRRGLTLVATSNSAPDGLYPDGLQRSRFLPAIAQLQAHTRVFELVSDIDYRLKFLERAETYHTPLDGTADGLLAEVFERVAPGPAEAGGSLFVNGRGIPVRRQADSVLWADFAALCDGPRSQSDYLELARCFHTLLLSGVPRMDDAQNDRAKRFIHLVDLLYDHNVTLIVSAAETPERLYRGRGLAFEYQRTASRLQEMQSSAWLARPHLG